jgi:hypothetical protein
MAFWVVKTFDLLSAYLDFGEPWWRHDVALAFLNHWMFSQYVDLKRKFHGII